MLLMISHSFDHLSHNKFNPSNVMGGFLSKKWKNLLKSISISLQKTCLLIWQLRCTHLDTKMYRCTTY